MSNFVDVQCRALPLSLTALPVIVAITADSCCYDFLVDCVKCETVSATSRVHDIKSVLCALRAAEAEKQYGQSSLKIYTSSFVPLYHAVTQRKTKTHMKMICLLPTEKVRFLVFNTLDVMDFQ